MTCQSLISDLSGVESPSVATARMHLLLRFSRYGPGKLAPHADGPLECMRPLKSVVLHFVVILRCKILFSFLILPTDG